MCEISIIIPVYNTEAKLLERCIQSIQRQTLQSMEIILVDDGSSRPDTVEYCRQAARQDSRVRLIPQSNQGQSAARKAGVELAAGRFVMFVDSDDALEPQACEHLLELILENNADLAECRAYSSPEERKDFSDVVSKIAGRDELLLQAVRTCDFPIGWALWGKLFRADLMKRCYRVDENIYYGEDVLCLVRYLKHADIGIVSDRPLYYYNIGNENSMTKRITARKLTMCAFGREMAALYEDFPIQEGRRRARAIYCDLLFGSYLLCAYQRFESYREICRSIRKEYKKYTAELWKNPYITARRKHLLLRYCPAAFFIVHGMKRLTDKTVDTVE